MATVGFRIRVRVRFRVGVTVTVGFMVRSLCPLLAIADWSLKLG